MPKRAVSSMAWEVLTMAPRMSGRLMRTGGMTKGLLGFIGAFGLYTASEGTAGEGCQDS